MHIAAEVVRAEKFVDILGTEKVVITDLKAESKLDEIDDLSYLGVAPEAKRTVRLFKIKLIILKRSAWNAMRFVQLHVNSFASSHYLSVAEMANLFLRLLITMLESSRNLATDSCQVFLIARKSEFIARLRVDLNIIINCRTN
ncbi:unnamed protein product [Onchocerca flexuosa]|uniref:Transposase n=1 Tax=Onchocerca flexuosa TaxID=387005 RepID=A0A183HPF6_9BILA|nr:unnamed protein product [Onchocerca flexuosa]